MLQQIDTFISLPNLNPVLVPVLGEMSVGRESSYIQ